MTIRTVRLGEVSDFIMGQAPPGNTVNTYGEGAPFYRSGEFGNRRPNLVAWTTNPLRISPADSVWVCVVGNNAGDINLGAQGAIGRSVAAIVPGEGLDFLYLYYFLRSREAWLRSQAAGSAQPVLSSADLARIEMPLPTLAEQREIAATLGALDDKIESNQRIVTLATDLAVEVLNGPGGPIRVGDVASISKGLSYKGSGLTTEEDPNSVPLFSLASFTRTGQLSSAGTKHYSDVFKSKHQVYPWDLLIANTDLTQDREIVGRGFIVPENFESAIHTHHTSAVRFEPNMDYALLLWAQLQTPAFRERAKGFATGTTVAAMPPEVVLDFEMTIPANPDSLILKAKTLLRSAWHARNEIEKLAHTREALLPELLSGRIRVGEIAT